MYNGIKKHQASCRQKRRKGRVPKGLNAVAHANDPSGKHKPKLAKSSLYNWATLDGLATGAQVADNIGKLEQSQLAFYLLADRAVTCVDQQTLPIYNLARFFSGHLFLMLDCQALTYSGKRIDYLALMAELDREAGRTTPSFSYKTERIAIANAEPTEEARQAATFIWALRNAQDLKIAIFMLYLAIFAIPQLRRVLIDAQLMTPRQYDVMMTSRDRDFQLSLVIINGQDYSGPFSLWAAASLLETVSSEYRKPPIRFHPLLTFPPKQTDGDFLP